MHFGLKAEPIEQITLGCLERLLKGDVIDSPVVRLINFNEISDDISIIQPLWEIDGLLRAYKNDCLIVLKKYSVNEDETGVSRLIIAEIEGVVVIDESDFDEKSVPDWVTTGFLLFSHERRANLKREYPRARTRDLIEFLGLEWQEMTEEEKDAYRGRVARSGFSQKPVPPGLVNGFELFAHECRSSLAQENPGISFRALYDLLQFEFRWLDEEEKAEYSDRVALARRPG